MMAYKAHAHLSPHLWVSRTYTCHISSYHYSLLIWVMYPSLFTNLQSIPLIFLDLRALLLLRAAPPPGGLPPLASDGGRLPERCSNYVNLYVNLSMYALISSQLSDCIAQDPLPN